MKSPIINDRLYNLSLFEVCEILSKSSRTVSRYIKNGILHPVEIKSKKGMPEYRFCREEIDAFKAREEQWRQTAYLPKKQYVKQNSFSETPASPDEIPDNNQIPIAETIVAPTQDETKNIPIISQAQTPHQSVVIEAKKETEKETEQKQEIIAILKETTEILRDQLKTKDDQIKNLDEKIGQLIERDRETNILLKGLQDKIGLLDSPKMVSEKSPTDENIPQPQTQEQKQEQTGAQNSAGAKEQSKTRQQSKKIKKTNPAPKNGFFSKLFG